MFCAVGRCFYNFPNYHRQLLVAPDGGTVAIDWFKQCDLDQSLLPDVPVLLVFHGLTGSTPGPCSNDRHVRLDFRFLLSQH